MDRSVRRKRLSLGKHRSRKGRLAHDNLVFLDRLHVRISLSHLSRETGEHEHRRYLFLSFMKFQGHRFILCDLRLVRLPNRKLCSGASDGSRFLRVSHMCLCWGILGVCSWLWHSQDCGKFRVTPYSAPPTSRRCVPCSVSSEALLSAGWAIGWVPTPGLGSSPVRNPFPFQTKNPTPLTTAPLFVRRNTRPRTTRRSLALHSSAPNSKNNDDFFRIFTFHSNVNGPHITFPIHPLPCALISNRNNDPGVIHNGRIHRDLAIGSEKHCSQPN